jgi:hypothetical protein
MKQNKVFIKQNTSGIETAVLRVFDNKEDKAHTYYASSRLGTIRIMPDGFEVDIPAEMEGKDFELKALPEKKVIAAGKVNCIDVPEEKPKKKEVSDLLINSEE